MKIVHYNEVKNELTSNIRRMMLIPIIGSGFTRGCRSYRGVVPSGEDYIKTMISQITENIALSDDEKCSLYQDSFPNIASIYHQVVPPETQESFYRDNFTKVVIEEAKKDFLSLPWPYIYTLNIDDGIEKGSEYKYVIYSNRKVNPHIFDDNKCLIKLHGDVTDMLTYFDSKSQVFSEEQYLISLKESKSLLKKLEHDSKFQNLLFIGCSLNNEIDILSSLLPSQNSTDTEIQTARYICLAQKPSFLDQLKYEKYGITHCIIFDSFENIYTDLFSAGLEAQKISCDELVAYKTYSMQRSSSGYENNKPYLLFGKSLLNKDRSISLPYFFISREASRTLIDNINTHNLQLLIGSRCSGKTYILADIASRIKDRDVFFFETKDRLSDRAFDTLLSKENCVILADNAAFSDTQFEVILNNLPLLKTKNISIIFVINKNNRSFINTLKLYELEGKVNPSLIPKVEITNTFSATELEQLNPLLTAISVGIFSAQKTIVDNIIETSERLAEKNKYHQVTPKLRSITQLASLIALGIERKLYSKRAIDLGLDEELLIQRKATEPLIDCESTWSFEKSCGDSSPVKYVINAEYWLCNQLAKFALVEANQKTIVDAYKHIIAQIVALEGRPNLLYGNNTTTYREYIFFNNINRLFTTSKSSGRKGLALIRAIYEGLNDLLSVDPNYMHQRSKCYIKSSYYEKAPDQKAAYLEKAFRDANVAHQVFSNRYDECTNNKLLISIAHITYTQALILCHQCYINNYSDIDANTLALQTLHTALVSPYNSYSFAKTDSFNYENVIGQIITKAFTDKSIVHPYVYPTLTDLFKLISEES